MQKQPVLPIKAMVLLLVGILTVTFAGKAFAETMTGERAAELAVELHEGMRHLSEVVEQYRAKNGYVPENVETLVSEGWMQKLPVLEAAFGRGIDVVEYKIQKGYDDMDGQGAEDDTIYTSYIPLPVCVEFNKRYAPTPLNEGKVFDYQAAGEVYPGKVYGRELRLYAIKWQTLEEYCELNWVIDYND